MLMTDNANSKENLNYSFFLFIPNSNIFESMLPYLDRNQKKKFILLGTSTQTQQIQFYDKFSQNLFQFQSNITLNLNQELRNFKSLKLKKKSKRTNLQITIFDHPKFEHELDKFIDLIDKVEYQMTFNWKITCTTGLENILSILLSKHIDLSNLDLSECNLGKKIPMDSLKMNLNKIKKLNFGYNNLKYHGIKLIEELLCNNEHKINELVLNDNGINDHCVPCISKIINENTSLSSIQLKYNLMSLLGVNQLFGDLMRNKISHITIIDLGSCNLSDESIIPISKQLMTTNNLTSLLIYKNLISDKGFKQLADALIHKNEIGQPTCIIKNLNLSSNQLKDKSIEMLGMKVNTNLEILNLDYNSAGLKTIEGLHTLIINNNNSLKELSLESINISNQAIAIQLINSLNDPNNKLVTLNLARNNLSDQFAIELSKLISNPFCKLNYLNLSQNQIGDNGSISIGSFLNTKKCLLKKLDLKNNKFTFKGANAILSALNANIQLKYIDLSSNKFHKIEIDNQINKITKKVTLFV